MDPADKKILDGALHQLCQSPRGIQAAAQMRAFLAEHYYGLDQFNVLAIKALIISYDKSRMTTLDAIDEALERAG